MKAPTIEVPRQSSASNVQSFLLVWLGQVISLIGSGLTGFALGVWTYQQTRSVTQLAIIAVCNRLPGIVISPLAGALVDRLDRRLILILCQLGAGASILSMALAKLLGHLSLWHICIALTINSALSSFQWLAFSAAITLLIPKKYFGRSSGLVATGEALGLLFSPLLGGLLIAWIQLQGIFLIDFVTFIFSFVTLSLVRIPQPFKSQETTAKKSLLREVSYGCRYLFARPGLVGLLLFFAFTNFLGGFLMVLTAPLILSFATSSVLGIVLSIGGSGLLIGSLVMSAWGGPSRRVRGVFAFEIVCGLSLVLAGVSPSAKLVALAAFIFYFSRPFINGCSQAIWQSKIPPELQGRVFATRRVLAWSTLPLAYLLAGPLADYLFEPLLMKGGPLASSVGLIIGTGPGRGIGFLFMILGFLTLVMVGIGYLYSRLRLLEDELIDCMPDAVLPELVSR
ncbi:MAG: family permease [Acidobacteria bacterium]|nr:family permease [Acidobacteriota bacterium]